MTTRILVALTAVVIVVAALAVGAPAFETDAPVRSAAAGASAASPSATTAPLPATARATSSATPSGLQSSAAEVLVGAGDIGECRSNADEATASLLDAIEGTVFTAGDNAYPDGTSADFTECYATSWGRHRDRTMPAAGNHDYLVRNAADYYEYFGSVAADGYYAYDLGVWRIYSLDSERMSDAQLEWLRGDLAANARQCVLAYWHRPPFSSGEHGNQTGSMPLWDALYAAGAEVVVTGHDHEYERFAPMDDSGNPADDGLREFVVGTGGTGLREFQGAEPNSEVRWSGGHGVIKFELWATGYSWEFVSVQGVSFTDAGNGTCH